MTYSKSVSFGALPYGFILGKNNSGIKDELNRV